MKTPQFTSILAVLAFAAAPVLVMAQANTYPWPASGPIGIGTTSPGAKVDINAGTSNGLQITTANANPWGLLLKNASSSSGPLAVYQDNSGWVMLFANWPSGSNICMGPNGNIGLNLNAGNVGIGTTSPAAALDVIKPGNANVYENGIRANRPDSQGQYAFMGYGQSSEDAYFGSVYTGVGPNYYGAIHLRQYSAGMGYRDVVNITPSGNVGIGTTTPGTPLEVNGPAAIGQMYYNLLKVGPFSWPSPTYFYIDTKIPFTPNAAPQLHITGYNYGHVNKAINLTLGWYVWNNSFYWTQYKSELGDYNPSRIRLGTYNDAGTTRVRLEIANDGNYWTCYFVSATDSIGVSTSYTGWNYTSGEMPAETGNITSVGEYQGVVCSNAGNVGIGTTSPTYPLTVNGTVRAKEVIVDTGWSDYVFDPAYRLQPLSEVESRIKAEGHLPGIPSAKEVNAAGISVGDMQARLLAKVEELTLHLIQQEKQMNQQQRLMSEQEKRMQLQDARIQRLEVENQQLRKFNLR